MKIREKSEGLSIFSYEDRGLTVKQRKVLGLVKQGTRNKEIASVLHISERTVRWHTHLILSALGIERCEDL